MIAKLTGTLDATGPDWAVIDVGGVGYLVHCSTRTLDALGSEGGEARLFTDLQVSENDMRLLGFAEAAERDWFRLLTSVQAWAARWRWRSSPFCRRARSRRHALAAMRRWSRGRTASGLSGRADRQRVAGQGRRAARGPGGVAVAMRKGGASADAVSALENLGFKPVIAAKAVAEATGELGEGASEGELIRVALKKAAG